MIMESECREPEDTIAAFPINFYDSARHWRRADSGHHARQYTRTPMTRSPFPIAITVQYIDGTVLWTKRIVS